MKYVDALFKIGVLVLLGLFLCFYINNASVGRYQQIRQKDFFLVVDTKTGKVYDNMSASIQIDMKLPDKMAKYLNATPFNPLPQ